MTKEGPTIGRKLFQGVEYISLAEAATSTPYSQEYLSLLARRKKFKARKLGRSWYVTRDALAAYLATRIDESVADASTFSESLQPAPIPAEAPQILEPLTPAPQSPAPRRLLLKASVGVCLFLSMLFIGMKFPEATKRFAGRAFDLVASIASFLPSGAPAPTMHSLQEIYDAIAGTFDATTVPVDRNGPLVGQLRYIESNLGWASGSNNIWSLATGNVGIGTTSPEVKFEVVGAASISSLTVGGLNVATGKSVTSHSLDWDEFVTNSTLASNFSVASAGFTWNFTDTQIDIAGGVVTTTGNLGLGTSAPTTRLDVAGTASASRGVLTDAINVGLLDAATVSYSRFGVGTADHGLLAASDILVSGALEVDGHGWFDSSASVAGSFETIGYASASQTFGSGLTLCTGAQFLHWDAATGMFSCGTPTTSSGGSAIGLREGFTSGFINRTSVSFDAGAFNLDLSQSDARLFLDYINGPASRTMQNTWTALNVFSAGASVSQLFVAGVAYAPFRGLDLGVTGGADVKVTSISFDANAFDISNVASIGLVKLDWTNGPASRSIAQTITGAWAFTAASNQFSNTLEIGTASISMASVSGTVESMAIRTTILGSDGLLTIAPTSGQTDITGNASISANLDVGGFASASQTFGSGLTDCDGATSDKLLWDVTTGRFSCGSDQGSGGTSALEIRDVPGTGIYDGTPATVSFDGGKFSLLASGGSDVNISLNWSTGPASRAADQTITGAWTFTAASNQFSNTLEIGTASIGSETVGTLSGAGLSLCTDGHFLHWNAGTFSCAASTLALRAGFSGPFNSYASLSFEPGAFNLAGVSNSEAQLSLDYVNGPASRAMQNTWTALNVFSAGASVSTNLEVSGTASVSAISIGGSAFNPANYLLLTGGTLTGNLFGTNASFSGNLEIAGTASISGQTFVHGSASISQNFEVSGYASASQTFGSGLTDCDGATSDKLLWDVTTGRFSCGSDQGAGGTSFLEIRSLPGGYDGTPATVSFDAGKFALTASGGSDVNVGLNWSTGPASRAMENTWTALNVFSSGASVSANLEVSAVASVAQLFIGGVAYATPVPFSGIDFGATAGTQVKITSISFDPGGFDVSNIASSGSVKLDWTNGPASRSMQNTWTALNIFSAGASFSNGEFTGYASASRYYGATLAPCTGSNALQWNNGLFSCIPVTASSFTGLAMHEGAATAVHVTDLAFDAGAFNFSNVASAGTLKLDWTNGPASRSIAQTITGAWTFTAASNQFSNTLEIGTASTSRSLIGGNSQIVLRANGASFSVPFENTAYASAAQYFGAGLTTCNGSNFLQWNNGVFGCAAGSAGSRPASNSLDWDEFVNASNLDANFSIASHGFTWDFTDTQVNFAGGVITTDGNIGIGSASSPIAKLTIEGTTTGSGAGAVGAIYASASLSNSTGSGFQFGNRFLNFVNGTTAGTEDGMLIRMTDNTTLVNTVRGLEVQAFSGTNTSGTNTGIIAFGKTIGIQGVTDGLAGSVIQPAAVFADLDNGSAPTSGNALRAFTDSATSANLVQFFQQTTAYTGTGLLMNFGNTGGSFNGRFMDLQVAGSSKFVVVASGATGIGLLNTTPDEMLDVKGNMLASTSGNVDLTLKSTSRLGDDGSFTLRSLSTDDRLDIMNGTTPTTLMSIASTGNVGIGVTAPATRLDVENTAINGNILRLKDSDGTCDHNPGAATETVTCSSDARLKTDITDAASAIGYLQGFRVRDYTVRASGERMTGVIAQELLETHPELVVLGSDGYYMVQQPSIWELVKGFQELASAQFKLDEMVQKYAERPPVMTASASTTGPIDVLGVLARAAETVVQTIRSTGDSISQGLQKTYYAVADLFPADSIASLVQNWTTRTVTIDNGAAGNPATAVLMAPGAQPAEQSKVDLEQSGAYLATYGVNSTREEIQVSGTASLVNGEARVFFDQSFTAIIASDSPIRVFTMPVGGYIRGQLYVEGKSPYGFIVRETGSFSNGPFDWLVIARRRGFGGDGPTPEPTLVTTPVPTPEPEIIEKPTPSETPEPSLEPAPSTEPTSTPEPSISPEISTTPEPTPEITPEATPPQAPEDTPAPTPVEEPAQVVTGE